MNQNIITCRAFTSSCSFLNSPFFHPSSRFSIGDVNGSRVLVVCKKSFNTPSTVPFIAELIGCNLRFTSSLSKHRGGSRSPPQSSNWKETLDVPDCNAIQVSSRSRRCRSIPAPSPCAPPLLHLRSGMEALKLHNSNVFSDTLHPPGTGLAHSKEAPGGRESERWLDWFQPNHFVVPPPPAIRASM